MDLFTAIHTRRSIRSFTEDPVADSDIDKILEAAMAAPSAGNQQSWSFIVIRDKEKLAAITKVHPYAKMLTGTTVAVLVLGKLNVKWPEFWAQDCAAATQNLVLAARGIDLASCWVGVYPEQDRMTGIRNIFAIPDDVMPFAVIPLGHSETQFKEIERFDEQRVYSEMYGQHRRHFSKR